MSGKRQFKDAMDLLRACADVGGDPVGPIPSHIRASARLAVRVEQLMRFDHRGTPEHIRKDLRRGVDVARDGLQRVALARGDLP